MRSFRPVRGNPWPHHMMITVNDDPHELLDLLWVREAWRLEPVGDDLPPALARSPHPVDAAMRANAPIDTWRAAWPELWHAALRHCDAPPSEDTLRRLGSHDLDPAERRRMLHDVIGPTWKAQVGTSTFTADRGKWQHELTEERMRRVMRPLDTQPERIALDALVPAWQAGLTTVVEIPCRGTFTRVIGRHTLLVTAETRADPDRYRPALLRFA